MWYGVEEKELDMKVIKDNGYLYDKLSISSPVSVYVITFPEEEWEKVQVSLHLPNVEVTETNLPGIVYYSKNGKVEEDNKPKVVVSSWNGDRKGYGLKAKFIEATERMLLPLFNKKIVISCPHGSFTPENKKTDEFHIRLWSQVDIPNPESSKNKYTTFWGIKIDCTDSFYMPSGKGVSIDSDEGASVGELLENTLYIHHDIMHEGTPEELEILTKVYEMVITLRNNPEEYQRILRDREVNAFGRLLNQANEKKLKNIDSIINKATEQVREYRSYTVNAERDLKNSIKERNFLLSGDSKISPDRVKKIWNEIKSIKDIHDVELRGTSILEFGVDAIPFTIETGTYETGPFKVTIDFINADIKVKTLGQLGSRNGCQHPHVNSSMNVCFGNIGDLAIDALTNFEFLVLINMILELLHNYTSSDAYEPINFFKLIKKNEPEK